LTELHRERLTLEELFVRIVSGEHKLELAKEAPRA
jgi:hypothetical protein